MTRAENPSLHLSGDSRFFPENHGLLLTAAAFNMMLSLILLSALLIVIVSHFFDEARLLEMLTAELALSAPGLMPLHTEVVSGSLGTRSLITWVGIGLLLVCKHGIDMQARTFTAWSHVVSLLFITTR